MKSIEILNIAELNSFLHQNKDYANGKNIRVDHLYETTANSRWNYENLWGIYLTNSDYAWMALWMAMTSRGKIKKRQIRYIAPNRKNDFIGSIEIYNPDHLKLEDIFSQEAYLYFFNVNSHPNIEVLDFTKDPNLFINRFILDQIEKRGITQDYYKPLFSGKVLVKIDDWQVALINYKKIIPTQEIILGKGLIKALSKRVVFTNKEIGQDYIKF
jgi:hypothetical protein